MITAYATPLFHSALITLAVFAMILLFTAAQYIPIVLAYSVIVKLRLKGD